MSNNLTLNLLTENEIQFVAGGIKIVYVDEKEVCQKNNDYDDSKSQSTATDTNTCNPNKQTEPFLVRSCNYLCSWIFNKKLCHYACHPLHWV